MQIRWRNPYVNPCVNLLALLERAQQKYDIFLIITISNVLFLIVYSCVFLEEPSNLANESLLHKH